MIRLAAGLFFLSGNAALIYEVLWTRQLGLVFGATTQAASAVLAAYMAGLALGAATGGRWADRTANPLRLFGVLEAYPDGVVDDEEFHGVLPSILAMEALALSMAGQRPVGCSVAE